MKKLYYLLTIIFLFICPILYAETHIQISEGINEAMPIAIIPFESTDNTDLNTKNISNIIRSDLNNSGKFKVLDFKLIPLSSNNIDVICSTLWKEKNTGFIVLGKIKLKENNKCEISYQLIDIINQSKIILLQNKYNVNKSLLRYTAHNISNEIFQKLTNIKGVFCTRIAYVIKNEQDKLPYKLQVSDYDGYNNFTAYNSINPIMSPTWSPDGKKIAFVIFENNKSSIVIQTLNTGIIKIISSYPNHNGAPSFSPDGKKLAFVLSKTGSLNIYIMDLLSNDVKQITNNNYNNTEPTWFPDNQTLAYTSDQDGMPQIYKINIYTKISKRLSWYGSKNQNSNISNDGQFIFMISTNDIGQHLIKQDLKTGETYELTNTYLDETPTISPNGTMVIYSSSIGNFSVLQLISTNGLYKTILPIDSKNVKFPSWSNFLD